MKTIFEYILNKTTAKNNVNNRVIPKPDDLLDYNAKYKFNVPCPDLYRALVSNLCKDDDLCQRLEDNFGFTKNDIEPEAVTEPGYTLISLACTLYGHDDNQKAYSKRRNILDSEVIKELFEDFWNDDIKVNSHRDSYSGSYEYTIVFPSGEAMLIYTETPIRELNKFKS